MRLKQITLAATAALFIAGLAGLAHAEGNIGTAASDEGSSAAMQAEVAAAQHHIAAPTMLPAGTRAYGHVQHHAPVRRGELNKPTNNDDEQ